MFSPGNIPSFYTFFLANKRVGMVVVVEIMTTVVVMCAGHHSA